LTLTLEDIVLLIMKDESNIMPIISQVEIKSSSAWSLMAKK